MAIIPTTLVLLSMTFPDLAQAPVSFERRKSELLVKIDERPFARYVWDDPTVKRPYFCHVYNPKGVQVTRTFPPVAGKDATDHATMHPGLWLGFGDISGIDFWRNKGVIRHAGFLDEPVADATGARFSVRNVYTQVREIVCEEVCRIRIEITPRGYLVDWQSAFSGPETFTFGDQEEMGLGVRLATHLTVTHGGVIRNSEGRKNEQDVWGRPADWCDYSRNDAGILMMPDPANFRRSWFHARDYGLLVANPFGRHAFTKEEPSKVVVKKGETLTLHFGVLIHDGRVDGPAAYQEFLKGGRGSSVSRKAGYNGPLPRFTRHGNDARGYSR